MTDKPIIFSGPMVRALLDGRKTQTRRVLRGAWQSALEGHDHVKTWFAPIDVPKEGVENRWAQSGIWAEKHGARGYNRFLGFTPYRPGDRLYVREAFIGAEGYERAALPPSQWGNKPIWYLADGEPDRAQWWHLSQRKRPSIHMPRWASRLTLTVTDVRVQRLQEISEEDARAEGCDVHEQARPLGDFAANLLGRRASFIDLWNSLHGPDAWAENPWVAAYTFIVERRNIDEARP